MALTNDEKDFLAWRIKRYAADGHDQVYAISSLETVYHYKPSTIKKYINIFWPPMPVERNKNEG